MNSLNIDSLFSYDHPALQNNYGPIAIDTLFPSKRSTKNSDELLREMIRHKKNKYKYYERMYEEGWDYICKVNKLGETDAIIDVVDIVQQCPDYNSQECIEYVAKKLKNQCLETYAMSNTSIFVTWFNLEEKKKNKLSK